MKFLLILSLAFAAVCVTEAGLYNEKFFGDPKHPGKCVVGGNVLKPGQSMKHPTMVCAEVTCDNANGMATIETCDPVSALESPLKQLKSYDQLNPPKCTWGDFKNTAAEYPKCCERHFTCVF